jgi:predicted nucleic acid-binding protein
LIEHCALETYSVLTRLPAPHRAPANLVRDFVQSRFPDAFLRLSPQEYKRFVSGLADQGVTGGAAYDALVAATAAAFDAELLTCDRRAAPIYERYAVRTQVIE